MLGLGRPFFVVGWTVGVAFVVSFREKILYQYFCFTHIYGRYKFSRNARDAGCLVRWEARAGEWRGSLLYSHDLFW